MPGTTLTDSGTAVKSRLQPFNVLTSPPDRSAKNSVHVPFGLNPLKLAGLFPTPMSGVPAVFASGFATL